MLEGIDPILTGPLLNHLDGMGHSDRLVIADAHFPAQTIATRIIELPGLDAPRVIRAIRSVLPIDERPCLWLMDAGDGELLDIHVELIMAAGVDNSSVERLSRTAFYDMAADSYLVVRTGETRIYGNAILAKGVVGASPGSW